MLIYRDDHQRTGTTAERRRLREMARALPTRPDVDAAEALLIATGEFESAACDALAPRDREHPARERALRDLTVAAARLHLAALDEGDCDPSQLHRSLDAVDAIALPATIDRRVSEGFAYYALYPETYAAAARRFASAAAPSRVHVIGIRSIGTTLSAVVAAALAETATVTTCTVRPAGHPFDRVLVPGVELTEAWRHEAAGNAFFAVVDEGPGLSGSSFASVVRALDEIGVPDARIVLFPSWDPAPDALKSPGARDVWRRVRRYVADAHALGLSPGRIFGLEHAQDWSAGRWRPFVYPSEGDWPAAHPQHERWKVHAPSDRRLVKFCGLGEYGRAAHARAERLAAIGVSEPPGALRRGFIDLPFVPGAPGRAPFIGEDAELVGGYIGRIACAFGWREPADPTPFVRMVEANLRELIDEAAPTVELLAMVNSALADAPTSEIDARMLPHEWIRTPGGLRKVDALDHHRDHFFAGAQNPAWDLAGAIVELDLDAPAVSRLLDGYTRASCDRSAAGRLAGYMVMYAAFRAGYAAMTADGLRGTAEGSRFARDTTRYVARLRSQLRPQGAPLIPSAP